METIESLLLEQEYKNTRKYSCPYCSHKDTRKELVEHVSDEHEEQLQNMSPAQAVFNHLNNTTQGKCRQCGKPTKWNEDRWKYDQLCGSEACKKKAREKYLKGMRKVYKKDTLLNDPEFQNKMIKNRSISGDYTYSNGEKLPYVGSYEKSLCEFEDEVLHLIPYVDVVAPGPTIEYKFKGKKHMWILDKYYPGFNLVIDVKDGGGNKNTHPDMEEYRQKQIAKEKAIAKLGTYNYARITDNDFSQLLNIFLDIKYSLLPDDGNKTKIHINESFLDDAIYLIAYSENGFMIQNYALSPNIMMKNVFVCDDETRKLQLVSDDFFSDKYYHIFRYDKDDYKEKMKTIEEMWKNEEEVDYLSCYELLKGGVMIGNQIVYDTDLTSVCISDKPTEELYYETLDNSIEATFNTVLNEGVHVGFPIINEHEKLISEQILKGYNSLEILQEVDGYYIHNKETNNRSVCVNSIYEIQPYMLEQLLLNF